MQARVRSAQARVRSAHAGKERGFRVWVRATIRVRVRLRARLEARARRGKLRVARLG